VVDNWSIISTALATLLQRYDNAEQYELGKTSMPAAAILKSKEWLQCTAKMP